MIDSRRRLRVFLIPVLACGLAWIVAGPPLSADAEANGPSGKVVDLEQNFADPPDEVRPWAYWWWLKGNVTEASITRDLEAMKRKGIAGLLMFDARGYHEDHVPPPESRMDFMGPEWRRMLKFAMSEAGRLGLEMSVNLSSCAGALKGPWLVGDDAPKKLVWTSSEVQGPRRVHCELRREENMRFWDVALMAVRHVERKNANGPPGERGEPAVVSLSDAWRPIQDRPGPDLAAVEVVDLSDKVGPRGEFAWDVPEGRWTLVRFGCLTMEGHEYDVDVLDENAVEGHFNRIGKVLLEDAGPLAGKTLTHFYSVSWEGAIPTWTPGFEEQFLKYRGYSPDAFLPVLAGFTVKNTEVSARFLRDYYKTLGDCFRDHFYGKLQALCHRNGIKWHSESGGPWNRKLTTFKHADQLAFLGRNDMPQGEFWWRPPRGFNKPPAMAAHIYGLPLAATEAFTHMQTHWSAYPAVLKPGADAAFCDGINHFIWHTFSASPPEFGKPGIEYFAGTHLNPRVTWWEQAGGFLTYLARCQMMLRQGRFVADVLCYTGDHQYLHWGRGEAWTADASLSLGKGYAYDLVNTEVLLSRLSVKNGDLVLPDGMRYRVLVVDLEGETVDTRALEKIVELAEQGATIVLGECRPTHAPGLRNYPRCDEQVGRLVGQLWGDSDRPAPHRALGRGHIISATPIDEALQAKGIARDFEGPWDYLHRRDDDLDVYFVAGSGRAECTFRTTGREPELWDPVTGRTRDAVWYRATDDGRTTVPIRLPENGSVFVVFQRPIEEEHLVSVSAPTGALEIAGRSRLGVQLQLWEEGRYELTTSRNERVSVELTKLPKPQSLAGPWTVDFTPGWGAPDSIVFEKLIPWNEHPIEGIRHFSGTGSYRTTFELNAAQASSLVRLQLGQVANVAEVRVNGTPLGVVWTAPWIVDLTGTVKAGSNELEIDVANLWVNRLIGDTSLPEDQRFTGSNVRMFEKGAEFRAFLGFSPDMPLEPSGLIGPVSLQFGSRRELPE